MRPQGDAPRQLDELSLSGVPRHITGGASQRYGRARLPPGSRIAARASSVSRSTARCLARLPGSPNIAPRGKRTCTQRGGRTRAVAVGLFEGETVGIPHASISRWISPPD